MILLDLLGSVDLTGAGGEVSEAPLRRSKRVALLAYLATARPRGFHRRDKIAALFWPELPTDRARAALRTTLSRLRDDHGTDLILGRGADELAVDTAQLRCDVVDFDAAIASGQFEEAVRLYRGPFLDGVHVEGAGQEFEHWIDLERTRLRDSMQRALSELSATAEKRGDLGEALARAQHALQLSPTDEIIARRVIALLVAAGNRGGAMRAYDELVRRLKTEHDVEPAAETEAVVASLRERHAVPLDVRPISAPATDAPRAGQSDQIHRVISVEPRRHFRSLVLGLGAAVLLVGAGWLATHRRTVNAPVSAPLVEWQPIASSDRGPPGSSGSRAVMDSTGDALLVFGGVADVERKRLVPMGEEYWRLRGFGRGSGASWTRITTASGPHPAARWIFGASSDPSHDQVVVHGGALGFTSPCANDTWVLHHASGIGQVPTWERVRIRGALPPRRAAFDQVFDAMTRRLIVFAGHDCIYPNFHDTWVLAFDDSTLSSGAWTLLAPDSSAGIPQRRDAYAATYDTASRRLFVFGGRASALPTGELWALDHANGAGGTPAWHPIHCTGEAPVLVNPSATFDVDADTWTFFGGMDVNSRYSRYVWRVTGLSRDLAHCRWEQLAVADPSPAARSGASAAVLPGSRGMVIFGGAFENTTLSDAWVLRPARRPQ